MSSQPEALPLQKGLVVSHSLFKKITIHPTSEFPPPPPEDNNNGYSDNSILPSEFALQQNYPNPFNPITNVRFSLPVEAIVTLTLYNPLGQVVATLMSGEELNAGRHQIDFDASPLSSGLYYYKLVAEPVNGGNAYNVFSDMKKMILLK
jgi:hypothetical protein